MKEEYKLIDNKKDEIWKLGKVTPRREKLLSELGLVRENFDSTEDNVSMVTNKLLEEMGEGLLKLLNGLFDGREIKKDELLDLDKTEVKVAVFSFFMRDLELLNEFGSLIPISDLLKSTTPK